MNIGYKPNQQPTDERSIKDAGFMDEKYQEAQEFPHITDDQFAEFDRYAGLMTPASKAIKDTVKVAGDYIRQSTEPITTNTPREQSKKGLKTPADIKREETFASGLDNMATEPTPMTDDEITEQAEGIVKNNFIAYDKNSKPSYMPRMDSDATYRLDGISTDEDLDSAVQHMAEQFKGEIDQSRRGVLGDNEANELANDLGVSNEAMQELLTRPDGSTANVEEVFAMRKLMEQSSRKLKFLAEKMRGVNASPEHKAQFEQAFLFHKDVLNKFMGYRAESGRSIRAYGVNMGGFQDATQQQEMLDLAMAGYDTQKIANIIANSDDTKGINDTVKTMSTLRKSVNTGMAMFINSILSGVSTQAVNIASGVMQLNVSYVDRLVAEGGTRIRMMMGRDTSNHVAIGEASALRVGMMNSWRTASKVAIKSFKTGEAYGGVGKFQDYENPLTSQYWGVNPKGFMGNMIDGYGATTSFMVRNVMGGTDAFFKVMAEQGQYTSLAYRKAYQDVALLKVPKEDISMELEKRMMDYMKNPTVDMIREATEHAKRMTYQDNLPTATAIQNMVKVQPWLKAFVPFVNTPTSIFKQNLINRTPLALFRPALYNNDAEGQIARSQALTGMMMMWGASELIDQGFITGSEPLSIEGKKRWESEGRKAHSFAIPDGKGGHTYVNYGRMENFAYPLSIMADFKDMLKTKELDWEYADEETATVIAETTQLLLIASMRSMEDKTFIAGFDKLIDVMSGGQTLDKGITNLDSALYSYIVPTVVPLSGFQKDVNAWFGDDKKKDGKELGDKFKANMIYLNKHATNRLDYYGRELYYKQKGNPFSVTYAEHDAFFKETDRLYKETMQDAIGYLPRRAKGVKLSSREYHDMTKYVRGDEHDGFTFEEMVKQLIKSDLYKAQRSDEMKVTIIKNAISKWDNGYIMEFISKDEELMEKYMKALSIQNKKKGRVE